MGSEAIVIPIVIDPKAGVAGLQQLGKQAEQTNRQFDSGTTSAGKFGDSMKKMAGNILQMVGVMKLADVATKAIVQSFMDWVSGANKLASAQSMIVKASLAAADNTRAEVVELEALVAVAKNAENSYSQRQGAIEQLLKKYPDLQGQLTLEKINTEGVAQAIDKVTQALVNKEKANLLIKQIAELENGIKQLERADKQLGGGLFSTIGNKGQKIIRETRNEVMLLKKELVEILSANSSSAMFGDLGKSVGGGLKNDIKLTPNKLTITPQKIEVRPGIGSYDLELPSVFDKRDDRSKLRRQMDGMGGIMNEVNLPGGKGIQQSIGADFERINEQVMKAKQTMEEMLATSERIGGAVADFVTPAFQNLFDAIVNNEDPLRAFFKSIGDSIQQLISQLIAAAIRAAALSIFTGGAAGGGLSFAGAFKKIAGFAAGGLVTGPVSALVGEGHGTSRSNPEVIAPLDRLQNFFRNMMNGNQGLGAASNMGVSGAVLNMPSEMVFRQRGRDLVAVWQLEVNSQGRTG